jgi:hypothetical protein
MKTRMLYPTLALVTLVLAACGPATFSETPPIAETPQPIPATEPVVSVTDAPIPSEVQPQPVVTPRGRALVATDPAMVNLESGTPMLLEFFRFT